MVVIGGKGEDRFRLNSQKYVRIVQKFGFDANFLECKLGTLSVRGTHWYARIMPKLGVQARDVVCEWGALSST